MSILSDDIIGYFQALPALANYTFQFGLWEDEKVSASSRYFVIQPSGGAATDIILEQPNYTLYLIGVEREGFMGFPDSVGEVADAIMKYLKTTASYGCYILIKEVSQPTGPGKTEDNRPWYSINIRTITGG